MMHDEPYRIEPINVLDGLEAVRQRPGMYFGNLGAFAVEHMIGELVSNCIDEFLCHRATELSVQLGDTWIEVSDDGFGLPFDVMASGPEESLATCHFTRLHITKSADNHAPHVHIHGSGGIGLAPVNAVSSALECLSWRAGKLWMQQFAAGLPLASARILREGTGRGTKITLTPDAALLGAAAPRAEVIRDQLFHTAHLFPGLKVRFQDEIFHAVDGLAELATVQFRELACETANWSEPPAFHLHTRSEDMTIHAAALGQTDGECDWWTWVNGSRTVQHGSHRLGFEDALREVQWRPAIAMIHLVMHNPLYAGPTKDRLGVARAREVVATGISAALREYCRTHQLGRFELKKSV